MSITIPSARPAQWAESGDTTAPSTGEQQSGFVVGKPSRRKMNWLLNWIDNAVQYLLVRGLPSYNSALTYDIGARVFHSGNSWVALADGIINIEPGTDATKWIRWGYSSAELGLSGSLAGGTVTSSDGDSIVSDTYQVKLPETPVKIVFAKLKFSSGFGTSRSATVTLSGAAAMPTSIDNVVVTLATGGYGGSVDHFPTIEAHKTGAQTIAVQSVYMPTASVDIDIHLMIQGH